MSDIVRADGSPAAVDAEPSITITFQKDGNAHLAMSPGIAWEHYVKAAALLSRAGNAVLDRAQFAQIQAAQETAAVAVQLAQERNGGKPSDIFRGKR